MSTTWQDLHMTTNPLAGTLALVLDHSGQNDLTAAIFPAYRGRKGNVSFTSSPRGFAMTGDGPAFALARGELTALGFAIGRDGFIVHA